MPQLRLPLKYLLALGILALIAAVYWPALHGGFIFDDYPIFAENPSVRIHDWHWASWQGVLTWSRDNVQRPMAMATYAFNYVVGGGTFGFKLTNLIIHLINTLLVMALARRLLQAAWPDRTHRQSFLWAAGIAAAWALHPLQVSTVMYVVQRMEMLGFTFVLLSLLAYWRGRQRQMAGLRGWPWLLLALVLIAVGYGFKETVVLAPGYALLFESTLLGFKARDAKASLRWKLAYATGCTLALLIAAVYFIPHYASPTFYAGRDFTAWQRELTQLRALPLYLGWYLLPVSHHLVFYYDNYAASTGLLSPITTLSGGLLLLALAGLAFAMRTRRPLIALGIGWFFVAHVLTSSPLPLELVFEHRNYPALFGIVLALADIVYCLTRRMNSSMAAIVACVLMANMAFLTVLRATSWSSPFQLAVELVEANPGSLRASMDLARRFMARSGGDANSPLYFMSIKELERAAGLPSDSPLPEEALLIEAAKHPDRPAQPWWDSLRHKLETRPLVSDTFLVLHKLTNLRLAGASNMDARQLADCLSIALARRPDREMLHADYAELAGAVLQDRNLAIGHWQAALSLDPNVADYGKQLAGYLLEHQRHQEAVAVIAKTIELRPALNDDSLLKELKAKALSSQQDASDAGAHATLEPRHN